MDALDWKVLRSTALLAALSDDIVEQLAEGQAAQSFERKTLLFRQGERAQIFYIVLSGSIKLFRLSRNGTEAIVSILHGGDTVGEAGLFLADGYPFSAEAITAVRLFPIGRGRLLDLLQREPLFARHLLTEGARTSLRLMEHIEEIKALSAQQRLADFVLSLCEETSGACSISLPYEKTLISGWLGMKPASLSRALARLRRYGVEVDKDTVNVRSVQRLLHIVSGSRREGAGAPSSRG